MKQESIIQPFYSTHTPSLVTRKNLQPNKNIASSGIYRHFPILNISRSLRKQTPEQRNTSIINQKIASLDLFNREKASDVDTKSFLLNKNPSPNPFAQPVDSLATAEEPLPKEKKEEKSDLAPPQDAPSRKNRINKLLGSAAGVALGGGSVLMDDVIKPLLINQVQPLFPAGAILVSALSVAWGETKRSVNFIAKSTLPEEAIKSLKKANAEVRNLQKFYSAQTKIEPKLPGLDYEERFERAYGVGITPGIGEVVLEDKAKRKS